LKALNMLSIILPIVALAGAAVATCPLSVEIVGATHHVAQVAVKNTGTEAVTVFKGNTVLSDHATKDLLVASAGMLTPSSRVVQLNLTLSMNRWKVAPF
jgi:deuterolysin